MHCNGEVRLGGLASRISHPRDLYQLTWLDEICYTKLDGQYDFKNNCNTNLSRSCGYRCPINFKSNEVPSKLYKINDLDHGEYGILVKPAAMCYINLRVCIRALPTK